MTDHDLETLEQRTFRTVTDDGLWDVLIAAVFANLAIAPLLSEDLGDFWSSALLAPIWLATYLVIRVVRHRIIAPRVGTVRFGADRQQRLRRLGIVMVVVNAIAAVLGVVSFIGVQLDWLHLGYGGLGYPLLLGVTILLGFFVRVAGDLGPEEIDFQGHGGQHAIELLSVRASTLPHEG